MHKPALVLTALLLAACGGGGGGGGGDGAGGAAVDATGPAQAQVVTVVSTDRITFEPATVHAKVGKLALTHRNGGGVPHSLVFTDKALGGTEVLTGGKEEVLQLTFTKAGTYDFFCSVHSGQDGKVVVS